MPNHAAAASRNLHQQALVIAEAYQPPAIGRPGDLGDATKVATFLSAIRAGNYQEIACQLAGLSRKTIHDWKERGNAGERPHAEFLAAVKQAEAEAEAEAVADMRIAGKLPQFWTARATFLERRFPDRWARRSEEGSGPKILVQIGCKDSEVQVAFACSTQRDNDDFHRLTGPHESDNGGYANPIEGLPVISFHEGPQVEPHPCLPSREGTEQTVKGERRRGARKGKKRSE